MKAIKGGTYRINSTVFPAPDSTEWEDQPIGSILGSGIQILNSYRIHRWIWATLPSEFFLSLASLFDTQQSSGKLATLETDPYDASLATSHYGTTIYNDFIILPLGRSRGLPNYDNATISFEVYIPT